MFLFDSVSSLTTGFCDALKSLIFVIMWTKPH